MKHVWINKHKHNGENHILWNSIGCCRTTSDVVDADLRASVLQT